MIFFFFFSLYYSSRLYIQKEKILDPLFLRPPPFFFATLYIRASINNLIDARSACVVTVSAVIRFAIVAFAFLSFVHFVSFRFVSFIFISFFSFLFFFICHAYTYFYSPPLVVLFLHIALYVRERVVPTCTCAYIHKARMRKPLIYFQPEIERVTIKLFRRLFRRGNKSVSVCAFACVYTCIRRSHVNVEKGSTREEHHFFLASFLPSILSRAKVLTQTPQLG